MNILKNRERRFYYVALCVFISEYGIGEVPALDNLKASRASLNDSRLLKAQAQPVISTLREKMFSRQYGWVGMAQRLNHCIQQHACCINIKRHNYVTFKENQFQLEETRTNGLTAMGNYVIAIPLDAIK